MKLTPRELDKLQLSAAGFVAQKRYARGLALNYPEAIALLSSQLLEFIRDGDAVIDLMSKGKKLLGVADVMPGVDEMIHEVQVEGTFPDGTKLVTVHQPICLEEGDEELALYGSGLTRQKKPPIDNTTISPGELFPQEGELEINEGREEVELIVKHTGDRPVQVGSHYSFFEVNACLAFDREMAFGMRLNIPSGTAVRFEPGEEKKVQLVSISGQKKIFGGNDLTQGEITPENKKLAVQRAKENGFLFGGSNG